MNLSQVCPLGHFSQIKIVLMFEKFMLTFSSVLGTVALVFYVFPYLGLIFIPMIIIYYGVSAYYRHSSVETKRLDSLMRSILYSSYTGSSTQDCPGSR